MDPRAFVLICLAAASRHQPSVSLGVEVELPTGRKHEFNETDFQRLRDGVNSIGPWKTIEVGEMEIWPSFLKAHPEEGLDLFKKLVREDAFGIFRKAAAYSSAWPMLLETHNAEAWRLFEKLATDEDGSVRTCAALSPAWPDLVRSNVWEAWRVFVKLMSDQGLGHLPAGSTSWKAFGTIPPTAVTEHLDSCTPTNLQEMAMSVQKVADNGYTPNIKDLPLFKALATRLQRSSNETWLGKMAEMPLFAGNAAQRVSPAQDVQTVLRSQFEFSAKE